MDRGDEQSPSKTPDDLQELLKPLPDTKEPSRQVGVAAPAPLLQPWWTELQLGGLAAVRWERKTTEGPTVIPDAVALLAQYC